MRPDIHVIVNTGGRDILAVQEDMTYPNPAVAALHARFIRFQNGSAQWIEPTYVQPLAEMRLVERSNTSGNTDRARDDRRYPGAL